MTPDDLFSPSSPLHPNLQAALSSLNINLEEELDRFRQNQKQRQGITLAKASSQGASSRDEGSPTSSPTQEHSSNPNLDPPQSYLASSEALLRHLDGEEKQQSSSLKERPQTPKSQKKNASSGSSWHNYLFTPLGIAGILIFFLSGTLLSLIAVNFAEDRFRNQASGVEQSDSTSSDVTDSSSVSIPNRPNLAEDEFIELEVDNLVEAEPAAETLAESPPRCANQFYCVMVETPSEPEYQTVRQLIPDAYLREFPEVGQVLQAGAFRRESEAKDLQQRLEQAGISATIYYP